MTTNRGASSLTQNRFRLLIKLLRISGIPIFMDKKSIPYMAYGVALYFCTFGSLMASWTDIFMEERDLKETLITLVLLTAINFAVWVNVCIRAKTRSLEKLLQYTDTFTWEDLPSKDPETGRLTSAGMIPMVDKVLKYAMFIIVCFHSTQSGFRVFMRHELLFPGFFPYDFEASPAFELTNLCQVLASLQLTCTFYPSMALFLDLVCIACSQCDKLKMALRNIEEESTFNELNSCIVHHQQILVFLNEMENTFSICLGGLLLLQMMACCIAAFSAINTLDSPAELGESCLIYLVSIAYICLFCWAGNILSDRVESIKYAAYEGGWIGTPVSYQKSILLIITRTNKEFILTGAKFVPISNETMINILKETLSLIMFLFEMRDNEIAEY